MATFLLASRAAADLPGHEPHLAGRGALGVELGGTMGYQDKTPVRTELWDLSFLASITGRYFVADRVAIGLSLGLQRSSRDRCADSCSTTYRTAAVVLATVSYFAPLSRRAYFVPELGLGAFGGGEESAATDAKTGNRLSSVASKSVGLVGGAARLSPGVAFAPWPRLWVFVRPDFLATFSERTSNVYGAGTVRLDLDFGATAGVSHAF